MQWRVYLDGLHVWDIIWIGFVKKQPNIYIQESKNGVSIIWKNTEKFENGIRNLKIVAEILVFGTLHDVIIPGLGQNRLIALSSRRRIRQKWQNFASRVSLGWRIQKRNQFSHILSICPSEWRHHDQIWAKRVQFPISWNKDTVNMKTCI